MVGWHELESLAPEIAAEGRRRIYARGEGLAMLATVRGDQPPRIHPINVEILDGEIYAFLHEGAKHVDLEVDGRFALHAHQDPADPAEFSVRGRASLVTDDATRAPIAARWPFRTDETYGLFVFSISSALLGERGPDEWPPRFRRWPAGAIPAWATSAS